MMGWALGLGGSDHDGSAALMHQADIKIAIEEERLTRRKHGMSTFFQNPVLKSVNYCLDFCGVSLDDVTLASSDLLPARVRFEFRKYPLRIFPHHLCHAAAAYMLIPPGKRAAVLVYDGAGSIQARTDDDPPRNVRETFTFYLIDSRKFECLGQTRGTGVWEHDDFPSSVNNSVGMFYEFISSMLGFDVLDGGKTMGLAAHGTPRFLDTLEQFASYGDSLDDCFRCELDSPVLRNSVERILQSDRGSFAVKADLAASAQMLVNKALVHAVRFFGGKNFDYLCISGGCAINTVANSFLVKNSPFDIPVVIPPYPGDSGLALGALWLLAREQGELGVSFRNGPVWPAIARPGRTYSREACMEVARQFYPALAEDPSVSTPEDLAHELAKGRVVAVFNGPSEIGPRALGGRSIFADPRSSLVRERINREIKHREPFRPLAPMVLAERYEEFFSDPRQMDPFMLKVPAVTERCRREAPAIVHVDGTARVQVVGHDNDPFLRDLLKSFESITGLPIILNTSFNRRGEPIVETPLDAIDSFLGMGLDGIYLEGSYYRRASA